MDPSKTIDKEKKPFVEGTHYYLESGRVIFTAAFHLQRGSCCGNGCRHCPFYPKYKKGNTITENKDLK
jgi:2-iminoacetate synthase ThiH